MLEEKCSKTIFERTRNKQCRGAEKTKHVLWGTTTSSNSIWLEVGKLNCEALINQVKENGLHFINTTESLKAFKL